MQTISYTIDQAREIPSLNGGFPFRLGTTSYILADDLCRNARFLARHVDDMELVLFDTGTESNIPDREVIKELAGIKNGSAFSYTVHMTAEVFLGDTDESVRRRSVISALRIIDITSHIDPFAYIVHFHGEMRGERPARDMKRWKEALQLSIEEILSDGVPAKMLCVETLDYPYEEIEEIVFRNGLSVCLDIGHLAFYGYPVTRYIDRYLSMARVIHLHGHENGSDHRTIRFLEPSVISEVVSRLKQMRETERVVTLEVFGMEDFESSLQIMSNFADRPPALSNCHALVGNNKE